MVGSGLVRRYKDNYSIPLEAPVTEEMILRHWRLERDLTRQLLASNPEHRWEVFDRCYTTLYTELRWLNEIAGVQDGLTAIEVEEWVRLIGPPPRRVYEVGPGKGRLVVALAEHGYDCTATEITRERGEKWTPAHLPVRWTVSDGIHLERFEPHDSYDAVISDQVIEHLHPDDLAAHFRNAHAILKAGGRYALRTPHAFEGPFDISRVFGSDRPQGMHLKEYTYRELGTALFDAGFARIEAPFRLPRAIRVQFGGRPHPVPSRAHFTYLCGLERMLAPLPPSRAASDCTCASSRPVDVGNHAGRDQSVSPGDGRIDRSSITTMSVVHEPSSMRTLVDTMEPTPLLWPPAPPAVRLGSQEVHVWCASLDEFRADVPRLHATLSPDERARAARFRFSRDRDDFIVCRGVLRRLLGQYVRREPSTIEFSYGRNGKPAVAAPGIDGSLHFNVSHSGALALYAVTADCPVGVDVERFRTVADFEQLASRFLAPAEASGVMALPPDKGMEGFFACWTRKEAFLKATGEGIGERLGADLPIDWQIHPLWPAAGYVAAIAYKHDAARLSLWQTSNTTLRPALPGRI